jgi:hypothetical protein
MESTDIAMAMAQSQHRDAIDWLEQLDRDAAIRNMHTETQWQIDYLDCGHFVAIPINAPQEKPHLVYENEPLHSCCIEALLNKAMKESDVGSA